MVLVLVWSVLTLAFNKQTNQKLQAWSYIDWQVTQSLDSCGICHPPTWGNQIPVTHSKSCSTLLILMCVFMFSGVTSNDKPKQIHQGSFWLNNQERFIYSILSMIPIWTRWSIHFKNKQKETNVNLDYFLWTPVKLQHNDSPQKTVHHTCRVFWTCLIVKIQESTWRLLKRAWKEL